MVDFILNFGGSAGSGLGRVRARVARGSGCGLEPQVCISLMVAVLECQSLPQLPLACDFTKVPLPFAFRRPGPFASGFLNLAWSLRLHRLPGLPLPFLH